MGRKSPRSLAIDPNVRCLRIYPTEDTTKTVNQLKTVGILLSAEQALHLGTALVVAARHWKKVDITAYRFKRRRSDDTYQITVTSTQ